jgi:tetratricopeptide (TPR) repeat protein
MKIVQALLLAVVVVSPLTGGAGSPSDQAAIWISKGLEAEARLDPLAALDCFRRADELRPNDSFILQKVAQQLSDAAFVESDPDKTEQMLKEAFSYAKRAVDVNPESAVNRLSLAVLYGRLAGYGDTGTKVRYAQHVRDEAEAALRLDETYAWAYHVLGRWHAEMSRISQAKRIMASLFYGGFSRPSLDTAIELLERAVELKPDAIAHRVELGFAYAAYGQDERARSQWKRGVQLDSKHLYDPAAKRRALKALGLTEVGQLD